MSDETTTAPEPRLKSLEDLKALVASDPAKYGSKLAERPKAGGPSVLQFDAETLRQRDAEQQARWAKRDAREREWQEHAAKVAADRLRKRCWEESGVPDRHQSAELDRQPEWQEALDKLSSQVAAGCIAVLLGPRGTGKTQLAVECIREATSRGQSARYVKASNLFREFRACFGENPTAKEPDLFNRYAKFDLLVIDEAHRRGHSLWENVTLTDLIDTRYDAMRATVLISNETKPDFAEAIGPSVCSRIQEVGLVLECDWASFRERQQEKDDEQEGNQEEARQAQG